MIPTPGTDGIVLTVHGFHKLVIYYATVMCLP